MKRQRVMSQMKTQDKTPEKQLNEVEIDRKRIQNDDGEDDPGSQKQNGEDARMFTKDLLLLSRFSCV